jgi:GrpB-like predicted nucleotidyltransferase (UPF0157 family)
MVNPVALHRYDPQWHVVFQREKTRLSGCVTGARIEHIGSLGGYP